MTAAWIWRRELAFLVFVQQQPFVAMDIHLHALTWLNERSGLASRTPTIITRLVVLAIAADENKVRAEVHDQNPCRHSVSPAPSSDAPAPSTGISTGTAGRSAGFAGPLPPVARVLLLGVLPSQKSRSRRSRSQHLH